MPEGPFCQIRAHMYMFSAETINSDNYLGMLLLAALRIELKKEKKLDGILNKSPKRSTVVYFM